MQTLRGIARATLARKRQELQDHPEEEREEILARLGQLNALRIGPEASRGRPTACGQKVAYA